MPSEVKTRRLNEVIALQNELSLISNQADLGKEFEVLVEGPRKNQIRNCAGETNRTKCVSSGRGT